MSDDGYYHDDDGFDDFHDMLYDADPDNDLADDLAEHAAHSPVWQDNPAEELRDYFSDWDYYSDDYFDDDPKLLNGVLQTDKNKQGGFQRQQQPTKRGRKRKLSEAREQQELGVGEMDALASCLKGTVWKSRSPEPAASYKQGIDRPVALRLSAEIMHAAYGKRQGFGGRHLGARGGDESWANDLSLADMGLKSEKSMSMHEKAGLDGEEEDVDSAEIEEQAVDEEDMVDEETVEAEMMIKEPYRVEIQTEPNPIESRKVQTEIDRGPSKRRKVASEEVCAEEDNEVPPSKASGVQEQSDQLKTLPSKRPEAVRRGKGRASRAGTASKTQEQEQDQEQTKVAESHTSESNSRKRKLSASESSATGPTASSRAKRAATTKSSAEAKATVVTAAATRPTRHKKK